MFGQIYWRIMSIARLFSIRFDEWKKKNKERKRQRGSFMIKKQRERERGIEWRLLTHDAHACNVSVYYYNWKLLETNVMGTLFCINI